jgi:GT2 family glycosyltransferase
MGPISSGLTVIIVLHYNGLEDTIICLDSLVPQLHPALELVVIDNGSAINPSSELSARYPSVPVLRLGVNQGWAGGNNAGIEWARRRGAELVCLLNNDTIIPPFAIDLLAHAARKIGDCLLHPAIDFADPQEGIQLDPAQLFCAKEYPDHPGIFELNFAYGACLMIPFTVIEHVGVFDERFFLQLEEQDYFRRAQKRGIPALCLPSARIIHRESRSFGGRKVPLKTYYMTRNSLLLSYKHDRGLSAYFRSFRKLIWSLHGLASTGSSTRKTLPSWLNLCLWVTSSDQHAAFTRKGVIDFMRHKFGRYSG